VANTVDPVGGAYTIEELTGRIEVDAAAMIERIDALGGTLTAIETGYIQREIRESAYRAQQAVDAGTAVVVGVNRFTDDTESHAAVFHVDPATEQAQIDRVRALRQSRSDGWREALAAVERAARNGNNLVPLVIAAVEQLATVGEIADTLRRVFGEHRAVD
jgi:methylmalonyl-CoA mutase N-terminal domain/subunit